MAKFPVDAPRGKAVKALQILGFRVAREKEHISMLRVNPDGSKTPLTMPNHPKIKASTLRTFALKRVLPRKSSWKLTTRHRFGNRFIIFRDEKFMQEYSIVGQPTPGWM